MREQDGERKSDEEQECEQGGEQKQVRMTYRQQCAHDSSVNVAIFKSLSMSTDVQLPKC